MAWRPPSPGIWSTAPGGSGCSLKRTAQRPPCTWRSAASVRALLLGAGGMLAHDLAAHAPPDVTLTPLTHAQLDVTEQSAVAHAIRDLAPAVVINAAGYTRVDDAERARDLAF